MEIEERINSKMEKIIYVGKEEVNLIDVVNRLEDIIKITPKTAEAYINYIINTFDKKELAVLMYIMMNKGE